MHLRGPRGRSPATRSSLPSTEPPRPLAPASPVADDLGGCGSLTLGDQTIGALHAISRAVDAFSEQDRARMVALAPAVATAMRNALVLQRERESWNHRRRLDEQKSAFMKLAARGLEEPLAEVEMLVRQLQAGGPDTDVIADQLLDRSRYLAQQIEEILDLSLRESTEIVLPAE